MFGRSVLGCSLLLLAQYVSADEPQWLTEARAREGKDVKVRAFGSEDGFFRGKAPAKALNKIVEDDGSYSIAFDMGGETPANCEVIVDGFDLGSILRATAELTFKEVEPAQGKVEQRAIERVDAGVFGSTPYIAIDWVYRVNDGQAPRLGGFKQIAMSKGGHGLYCAHLDLGYAKTFLNAARSLGETIEFAESAPQPYYAEISTAKLGASRIGLMIVTMERDEEGDSKVLVSTSLAVPVTPDTLTTQDSSHVQWVRPDGSLINASHVVSENGDVGTNLALTADDDDGWLMKGTFEGKSVESSIPGDRAPETWIAQAQARRSLFAEKNIVGRELVSYQWTTADPTQFVESRTKVLSVIDPKTISARETLASLSMDVVLDKATGMASKGVMPLGPQSLELERVYVDGEF